MKKLSLLFVLLLLCVSFVPTQAGKPKPTPNPYPVPDTQSGTQAYPGPGAGLPGPELPNADPRPGIPYSWGFFGKWYVSVYPTEILTMEYGTICIHWIGHGVNHCYEIGFEKYYPETKTLLYSANPEFEMCDKWWDTVYVFWLGQWADIRTPDVYFVGCTGLPLGMKSFVPNFMDFSW